MSEAGALTERQVGTLLSAALTTGEVFVLATALGTALGLAFGIMSISENRLLRIVSRAYVEVARGASAIVQLFFAAFAIPIIFGLPTFIFTAAVLAIGFNMGGYGAEVVRTGIQSVPAGQREAAIALNLGAWDRLRRVILPQALVVMMPPYGNLNIEVLKSTALISLVGLTDLTYAAQNLRTQRALLDDPPSTAAIFGTALLIYFVLSQILAVTFRWLERTAAGKWYKAR